MKDYNHLLDGAEIPVDAIWKKDDHICIITDKDILKYRLGLIDDPYDQ